jgi:hypothetical protein
VLQSKWSGRWQSVPGLGQPFRGLRGEHSVRIPLTGAASDLGGNCLAELRAGRYEVLPVDVVRGPGITSLDLSNREVTPRVFRRFRPELALRLAALASVPRCEDDPAACGRVNLGATLSVPDGWSPQTPPETGRLEMIRARVGPHGTSRRPARAAAKVAPRKPSGRSPRRARSS